MIKQLNKYSVDRGSNPLIGSNNFKISNIIMEQKQIKFLMPMILKLKLKLINENIVLILLLL